MHHNTENTQWISQQKLADDLGFKIQRVHNWIKRKNIEAKYDESIKMWLVNPDSINIKTVK
jgi:hypothetical protein